MGDKAVILLVEDSEDDVLLIRSALSKATTANDLHVVHSGDEAISYLSGGNIYSDRIDHPFPDLVLLDLYMPGISGFEVLRWIRRCPRLETLKVVVLTGSKQFSDVNEAYRLGATSFLVKPADFQHLAALGKSLLEQWLREIAWKRAP